MAGGLTAGSAASAARAVTASSAEKNAIQAGLVTWMAQRRAVNFLNCIVVHSETGSPKFGLTHRTAVDLYGPHANGRSQDKQFSYRTMMGRTAAVRGPACAYISWPFMQIAVLSRGASRGNRFLSTSAYLSAELIRS
jgi:hypothetical protein